MEYIFDNERPIYIQLVEQIRIEIISGKLLPGEKIISVRELAVKTKVNPNTALKALNELEVEKLIYTDRTNGKYVTNDLKLIEKTKQKIALEKINNFIETMNNIGITKEDIKKYMRGDKIEIN